MNALIYFSTESVCGPARNAPLTKLLLCSMTDMSPRKSADSTGCVLTQLFAWINGMRAKIKAVPEATRPVCVRQSIIT